MRLLVQHRSQYTYPQGAVLGPHSIRLKPASHAKAQIETYSLSIEQEHRIHWLQDPYGNHIARVTFAAGRPVRSLDVLVELALEIKPVNPFDFFLDDRCEDVPFAYPRELERDLAPFLDRTDPAYACGRLFDELLASLPRAGATVPFVVELNRLVNARIRYVIREEAGIWTPEETLARGSASCRDSATLLVAVLRARGLAARFASGYLIQLTDEGLIPDQPKGVSRDVVDLHAWAEVFLPGAGWLGLDATSGLLCGEGHVPLACTATPALAAPIEGTTDVAAGGVAFSMTVGRLGHEARPTAPYTDAVQDELRARSRDVDARLAASGVRLTMGGEPTFTSREHPDLPEWNGDALGPTKWTQGLRLAEQIRDRLAPGGVLLRRMGKHYPGESLPRWAIDAIGRADGTPIWSAAEAPARDASAGTARDLIDTLAARLGVAPHVQPAYEDPWRFLMDEASLPIDVDPLKVDLDAGEARKRLARVLDRGLGAVVGWVLPLAKLGGRWVGETWTFRRGRLHLLQGDAPVGLRLPLASLGPGWVPPAREIETWNGEPDPRQSEDAEQQTAEYRAGPASLPGPVRTALCTELRDGTLYVFLPPLASAEDFIELVGEVDAVRRALGVDVVLEGYPPPPDPLLVRCAITPDPGVLEVNIPPRETSDDYAALMDQVFDAALASGLCSEKYLVDGRMAGSGGGHHLTLGGPSPLASPFVTRPDLLASLLVFLQHHPALSYAFTGLFVGPTSQAPRVDEARHESIYELEIALRRAFEKRDVPPPPWLADLLLRHLLVDVTGNTHRTELSIDKLWDWQTPTGRQGLVEFRAFEMPPHVRMAFAQMALVRALVASFTTEPYDRPLVRWGQTLHDRFLLPYWIERDLLDVLAHLEARGVPLPHDAYRPFVDLRCPLVGTLHAGDVTLEIRNAIEPWHVLGEEVVQGGTARYVDSSMERVEVRVDGLVPERHAVTVNGVTLPLRATARAGQYVAGVRFRAWAPPHSLHAHLGIHHPLRFDVLDTWGRRSLGACAYHVWHPEGRAFDAPPLTRFEAAARRAQRFTTEHGMLWPAVAEPGAAHPDAPYGIDLRRYRLDRPMPEPEEEEA